MMFRRNLGFITGKLLFYYYRQQLEKAVSYFYISYIKICNTLSLICPCLYTDYNTAKRINRHAEQDEKRYMKEDWKRFFYAICRTLHVEIKRIYIENINYAVNSGSD